MTTLISVKAGRCATSETNSKQITPSETPGTISLQLNSDDELLHFLWSPRKGATSEEEFDLIVFPGDASFVPYTHPTNKSGGRIFVLKFSSSSQRHFFWLQTKAEGAVGKLSRADTLVGKRIDRFLQNGGDIEDHPTDEELLAGGSGTSMEIDENPVTQGEDSRRGGEDGGRAAHDDFQPPETLNQLSPEYLQSLLRGITVPGQQQQQQLQRQAATSILSLPALLPPLITIPLIESAELRKRLLENLPPSLTRDITTEGQEKELLRRVLHSPQLIQAATGMTVALREGGLRGVADSLGVKLDLANAGSMGGVEMFVDGVKQGVEQEMKEQKKSAIRGQDEDMGGTS